MGYKRVERSLDTVLGAAGERKLDEAEFADLFGDIPQDDEG
ncbi:MAG TPA: hypothetical protein VN238_00180 [Solirubrobacteraceae bacterium]|nr:hypothetical protein [Solirubrobacteraceae bacterium]